VGKIKLKGALKMLEKSLVDAVVKECKIRQREFYLGYAGRYIVVECPKGSMSVRTWEDFRFVFGGKGWQRSAPTSMVDPYQL
jgi:hypothetical protein